MMKRLEPKNAAVRLTSEDREIVERLKKKLGVDFSSIVKMALRLLDERESRRQDVAAD